MIQYFHLIMEETHSIDVLCSSTLSRLIDLFPFEGVQLETQ